MPSVEPPAPITATISQRQNADDDDDDDANQNNGVIWVNRRGIGGDGTWKGAGDVGG